MRGVNKVILVGNLGKDPEVKYFDSGVAKASFPLATSESYVNKKGEKIDTTEWHNIVLWRGLAEVAEKYLKKGNSIYIEGKIKTRSWDDQDGNKKYITEIEGANLVMLGGRSDGGNNSNNGNQSSNQTDAAPAKKAEQSVSEQDFIPDVEDDLPF